MSDPTKLDLSDYFAAAVTAFVAGMGGAMAWFTGARNKLTARMDEQDGKMDSHTIKHFSHETQLAVIHTNQDHMSNRLDEIRTCTAETNEKLGQLSETLTDVLITLQRKS